MQIEETTKANRNRLAKNHFLVASWSVCGLVSLIYFSQFSVNRCWGKTFLERIKLWRNRTEKKSKHWTRRNRKTDRGKRQWGNGRNLKRMTVRSFLLDIFESRKTKMSFSFKVQMKQKKTNFFLLRFKCSRKTNFFL